MIEPGGEVRVSSTSARRPFAPGARRGLFTAAQLTGIALVAPALIVVFGVLVYPVLYNVIISIQAQSWVAPPEERGAWVGLANYSKLLGSNLFGDAWLTTGRFVLVAIAVQYLLGLGMALVMSSGMRGVSFVRTAFLTPMMLAPVVVGIEWRWLLSGNFGVVRYALRAVGFDPPIWLSDPTWALYALVVADAWQHAPFIALILLATLQSIPLEIYEAARVDGASGLRMFRSITFPLITSASLIAVLIRFGDLLKAFDLVYVMTAGGPGKTTEVVSLYTFWLGFSQGELGQAAAAANIVALVAMAAGGVLVVLIRTHTRIV